MYRSHTCGELRISDVNKQVTLAGWVQRSRKMGGMTFVDLRDRYGITQLVFNEEVDAELCEQANRLGREFVIQIVGTVNERFSKNKNIPTGDIEIIVSELNVLNSALTPPFTIEENFGATAGVAEMLLQSQEGCIEPLAALPEAWKDGSYNGLVARGNFEVSVTWKDGKALEFNILSRKGGICRIKYTGIEQANIVDSKGNNVKYHKLNKNQIEFRTSLDESFCIRF